MKHLSLFIWLLIIDATRPDSIDSVALNQFKDAVVELQNSELMRHGTLSVSVKNVSTGKVLTAMNHQQSLPSASTLKLVTTATALSVLGGDFTYKTYLEYDGQVENDTLKGNLYLRGTGDPTLGSDRFKGYPGDAALIRRWTEAVRNAGIRYVQGQVVADASYFDEQPLADSWIWGDVGNYYGAGVRGLNFNENMYRVYFRPGQNMGDPTEVVGTSPSMPYMTFTNRVTTGESGSGDQVIIYSSPIGNGAVLTGTVPRGVASFSVKGAIPDAAYYVASALQQSLLNDSIMVAGGAVVWGSVPGPQSTRTVLNTYTSPPLRDITQETNWWSVNLFADALLKTTGKRLTNRSDFDSATGAVATYWQNKGVDVRGFYIKDGSGLSPTGSLTTQNLTDILNAAAKDKAFDDFYRSIAVMGQSGTVRNLGKGTRAAGNIRAKSGSIEGTRAFAGYVTTRSGERLSFTIIAHKYQPENSRQISRELVQLMTLLASL
ncbi:D-alanyl-D-alanine carboxypeptidase/D-alanyl-D-alanine-endopeptidase [Telluribacter sp. SYSU D00476]|uniref:D-alanyl-D-alanine carboxypeptidase/D-alanyl-D-alanine endopeptidase n=1 Tax=Telluribacter sp. SYSU D00476 TaxID=2811430 RepID=UPI001FF68C27|nr:D-alanyl-D-alanine carboxypeptidase/D-alanyl-D-alanine-endopeptidase [Telluribacter sp. SYSU D00476]